MNPLIRLVDRLVRRKGYHVRRHNPLGLGGLAELNRALTGAAGDDPAVALEDGRGGAAPAAGLDSLTVTFRTCLREKRNVNPRPRITGSSLEELTLRCARSLVRALDHADAAGLGGLMLRVLDDRSDPAPLERLSGILGRGRVPFEIVTTAEPGQGPSLFEQFDRARSDQGLVYFVEDDWLHEATAIADMWRFYRDTAMRLGGPLVIVPQEHHFLYADHPPSFLLVHGARRWRTVNCATHTFLTHSDVVRGHFDKLEPTRHVGTKKRKLGTERATSNRLFEHMPAFSPIPAAAVHMQYEDMLPPLYDWRSLWEANAS